MTLDVAEAKIEWRQLDPRPYHLEVVKGWLVNTQRPITTNLNESRVTVKGNCNSSFYNIVVTDQDVYDGECSDYSSKFTSIG